MSTQSVSSRSTPAARPAVSSFKAAFLSFAQDMWHSYMRHSQYQMLLSSGNSHRTPQETARQGRRASQR
ncbi:MAG: hypothetical protein EPN73_04635 [Paraburkholderia sp.]|uniref:Uncharacterized protein n=1 Tax=Paraburkholderia sartisoli TaxID=83784 RepID=A0A1H4HP40_9BURK|nr:MULTISPECIES: hypothetical protein [Paraburkholderia]TAL98014.1 MAG: hypothetical protein EPN73_04635 [Paraburkholderia sp.]SEB23609.1 hypothetical protein SAMN05192564_11222 [Paraburkholderia sartisoli]